MNNLYNKTILIGREPGANRLLIAINVDGAVKLGTIGENDSVNRSVSRCRPGENMAHCMIEVSNTGAMKVVNINDANMTYVDGALVESKRVTADCKLELGCEKYPVKVKDILAVAKEIVLAKQEAKQERNAQSGAQPNTNSKSKQADDADSFSIKGLEKVWNDHNADLKRLQKEQKRLGLIKGMYLPCTLVSSAVGFLASSLGSGVMFVSYFLYALAAVALFYGLYKTFTDNSLEVREKLNDEFIDNYSCPNPKCGHFMGNLPYKVLRQNKNCPYCRCKFTED